MTHHLEFPKITGNAPSICNIKPQKPLITTLLRTTGSIQRPITKLPSVSSKKKTPISMEKISLLLKKLPAIRFKSISRIQETTPAPPPSPVDLDDNSH